MAIDAAELVVLARAEAPVAASARMTGKYSGLAPAITALTATFSTVYSQASRGGRWAHPANHGVRAAAGAFQHAGDPLLGGQDDGQHVGPEVFDKDLVQVFFSARLYKARRGAVKIVATGLLI